MTLLPDLFSFAYVPNWYIQLDELAALALPEPWRFRNPAYSTKNPDNPILERTFMPFSKNKSLTTTQKSSGKKHRTISMWRTSLCVSILAFIPAGTRPSMAVLTAIRGRTVC